jgi:hypothetical protein
MTKSIKTEPPHPFVILTEAMKTAELPAKYPTESGFAATASCIYAPCDPADGDVTITIGPAQRPSARCPLLLFDGVVATPKKMLRVWTSEWELLLEETAPAIRTRVRVWGNRPRLPDEIVIGLSEAD